MNEVNEKPNYNKAQNSALKLLKECGYTKPVVKPIEIANEIFGIKVYLASFSDIDKNVSGLYDYKQQTIFVNENESQLRQSFTVAHELGHVKLHQEWVKSNDYKVLLRTPEFKDDPKELEADTFAAHLLVPRYMLNKYYKIASVQELSRLFGVSEIVINKRLVFEYGK